MAERARQRPVYDPDEERRAGYAALSDVLLGYTEAADRAWVRFPGRTPHDVEVIGTHERTHRRLILSTTVGNVQELLVSTLRVPGLDKDLRSNIQKCFDLSVSAARFVHEGCATYISLNSSRAREFDITDPRCAAPTAYYAAAMDAFEEVLGKLAIAPDSKCVMAEVIARFALSPSIYDLFGSPRAICRECIERVTAVEERFSRLMLLFQDAGLCGSFARSYERVVKELYSEPEERESRQSGSVSNIARSAQGTEDSSLKELAWVYDWLRSQVGDMDICYPEEVLHSVQIAEQWERELTQAGLDASSLPFRVVSAEEINAGVSVRPPNAGLTGTNLLPIPSRDFLRILKERVAVFAQLYVHRDASPFVLNAEEERYVRNGEAYVQFHRGLHIVEEGAKGPHILWEERTFYWIERWPGIMQGLVNADSPLTWLCLSETELRECVVSGGSAMLSRFTNPVVGLVDPNDLASLKRLVTSWRTRLASVSGAYLQSPESIFLVFSPRVENFLLLAPTLKTNLRSFWDWAGASADWLALEDGESARKRLPEHLVILQQGVALHAF